MRRRLRLLWAITLSVAVVPVSVDAAETLITPGGDRALDERLEAQSRLFHAVHAAPFGIGIDARPASDQALDALRSWLASPGETVKEHTGRHPFELVGGYGGPAGIGLRGGGAVIATAFRLRALKREGADAARVAAARRDVVRAIETLHVVVAITGEPGRVARGVQRLVPDDPAAPPLPLDDRHAPTPLFDDDGEPLPPEKNNGTRRADNSGGALPAGHWEWEDSCSRDQLVGWVTAMGVLYDAAREDEVIDRALITRMEEDARAVSAMLREAHPFRTAVGVEEDYDLIIMDADGRPTLHHSLNPQSVEGIWVSNASPPANIFHLVMAWGILKVLHHVGGDPETEAFLYDELLQRRGWLETLQARRGVDYIYAGTQTNYSNVNMIALSLFCAIHFEDDPSVLAVIGDYMEERWWDDEGNPRAARRIAQPYFHALYLAMTQRGTDAAVVAEASGLLAAWPVAPYLGVERVNCDDDELAAGRCLAIDGTTELILDEALGRGGHPVATTPLHPSIRPPSNFDARSDPFRVNGGGGGLLPGGDLVSAYWLMRWLEARAPGEPLSSTFARPHLSIEGPATGEDTGGAGSTMDASGADAPQADADDGADSSGADTGPSPDHAVAADDGSAPAGGSSGGGCAGGGPGGAWFALFAMRWARRRREVAS